MGKRNKEKERRELAQNYSFVLQFGLNMIIPILGCTLLGSYIDDLLSTNFIVLIGFVIGMLAGYTSIYKTVKKRFKKENEDEEHH